MNLHFFLICFGVLGCYAAIRTANRGLRVIILFVVIMCALKVMFGDMPKTVVATASPAVAPQQTVQSEAIPHVAVMSKVEGMQNNRCAMYILENSPLGIFAYGIETHKFLLEYHQLQTPLKLNIGSLQTVGYMVEDSFGPGTPRTAAADDHGQPPSICGRVAGWVVDKIHLDGALTRVMPTPQ